jgi:tripartite-type tricarboxylate transporter receptor subunit TctC
MKATVAGFALTVLSGAFAAAPALAQTWPARPVRLVVPYVAGGPVDIMGRVFAQKLTDALGQQVIVDNRAGASGNIGGEIVARAAPDGYTLFMGANGPIAVNPNLFRRMPFDPQKDLAPITMVAASPMILVAHPSLPAANMRELVSLARSKPGGLAYASSGNGSTSHLATELLKSMTTISMLHVPYKGAATALGDVVSGQVALITTAVSSTLPFVNAGKLKALGVSSEKRLSILPDVPAIAESVPGYEVVTWYGVFTPAGTPKPVLDRLHETLVKSVAEADTRARLAALGADPRVTSPAEFAEAIRRETAKWATVVKAAGMRVE